MILSAVGVVGVILGFVFMTLAIASGLYYLSEVVEEHTVLTKKTLTRLIWSVMLLQVLLAVVDGFPAWLSAFSMASHAVYMANLRRFPIVRLTEPTFVLSCLLVFANHFLWFRHFSLPPSMPPRPSRSDDPRFTDLRLPTFTQVASFFGICVWLVPFALFISLSASDNVLPSMGSEYATGTPTSSKDGGLGQTAGGGKKKSNRQGLAKALVDKTRDWVGESGELLGFWKGDRTKRW